YPAHHPCARGLLQVTPPGAYLRARSQAGPAAAARVVRHVPPRGRAPSRVHRASILRRLRMPARPRPDAQPPLLGDPGRAEAALGGSPDPAPSLSRVQPEKSAGARRPVGPGGDHFEPSPRSLTLAAMSVPAWSTLTERSISRMIPSLSM